MIFRESHCFLGKCLIIDTADVEMAITLDVGPRIISLHKKGGKNIFFNDLDDQTSKDVSGIFGVGERWHIYGGHRVWVAPEGEDTYIPDNGKVEYQINGNKVLFIPQPWAGRDIAVKLGIEVIESNLFKITMYAQNIASSPQTFALWHLTVCRNGGELDIVLPDNDTGYLPNRNIVLWSYSNLLDTRVQLTNTHLTVRGSVFATTPLKIGTFNPNIHCSFRLDDTVFIKEASSPKGLYPDMQCNIETYTNDLFHEIETLSPLESVPPNAEVSASEYWRIL